MWGSLSTKHVLLCTVTFVIVLSSVVPLLLMLYPLKCFRIGLSKCRLDFIVVEMFVKKFHRCYKDDISGQYDMRSCSGLYFVLRLIPFLIITLLSRWILMVDAIIYSIVTIATAFLKPYKKIYMNVLDTLILLNCAVLKHLVTSSGYGIIIIIYTLCLLPGSLF